MEMMLIINVMVVLIVTVDVKKALIVATVLVMVPFLWCCSTQCMQEDSCDLSITPVTPLVH